MLWAWIMVKGDSHGRFGGNFRDLDDPLNSSLSDAFCNWWTTPQSLSQVILGTVGKDGHIPGSTVSRKVISQMQPFTHSLTGLSVTFQHPEQETNTSSLFPNSNPMEDAAHWGWGEELIYVGQGLGQGWNSHWAEALLRNALPIPDHLLNPVEKVVCLF